MVISPARNILSVSGNILQSFQMNVTYLNEYLNVKCLCHSKVVVGVGQENLTSTQGSRGIISKFWDYHRISNCENVQNGAFPFIRMKTVSKRPKLSLNSSK